MYIANLNNGAAALLRYVYTDSACTAYVSQTTITTNLAGCSSNTTYMGNMDEPTITFQVGIITLRVETILLLSSSSSFFLIIPAFLTRTTHIYRKHIATRGQNAQFNLTYTLPPALGGGWLVRAYYPTAYACQNGGAPTYVYATPVGSKGCPTTAACQVRRYLSHLAPI
jgi:hypothetical protein